jgi:hypothetical protein
METEAQTEKLTSGQPRSCGCLALDRITNLRLRHGHTQGYASSKVYQCWKNLRKRCDYPSDNHYHLYGARGIAVCERWRTFENFLADMGDPPTPEHSIERRDNNGDYEPGNCIWATGDVQRRNTRINVNITFLGLTMCATDWSAWSGINQTTLRRRYYGGLSGYDLLLDPPRTTNQHTCRRHDPEPQA